MSRAQAKGGLERFSGKKGDFAIRKDKVLTYVNQKDTEHQRSLMEKGHPETTVVTVQFLSEHPAEPSVPAEPPKEEEAKAAKWQVIHWKGAHSAMQNMFNQTLPNGFLSTLPDSVSKMRPCDIWKILEQSFGLKDAGGLVELTLQWNRLTSSNWSDLSSQFASLKQLRNDINRKTKDLVGTEMVTEAWLCFSVLSQRPSEFWASFISMTKDSFNIDTVEMALRKVFGDRSRKDIGGRPEKKHQVAINTVRHVGKKRNQDATTEAAPGDCFYYFKRGHMKKECSIMKSDRDPQRPGGPLFRTDIRTLPGQKKKKPVRAMAVSAVEADRAERGYTTSAQASRPIQPAMTTLEKSIADDDLNEVQTFVYQGSVDAVDALSDETADVTLMEDDEEEGLGLQ